ncbi:hypothetical protein GOB17_23905 [Sinorhizobium meliloti]|uniref:hypothetical protein n=1 Tax=Rhizobium meliloti TaxID=382 RepID=UPI00299EAD51|nr:hypothetical protein [Sinorhizobium meliloti]
MAIPSIPATAEGMPKEAFELFLRAQNQISECIDLSRLVFNSIEGLELDEDLKAISFGANFIETKLKEARTLLDRAKGWPLGE